MRAVTFDALTPELADWPRRREVIAEGIRALALRSHKADSPPS
ncbi:hypothetical protein [Amycolatopsis magusensis]